MKVLVACEESQAVCKAFRERKMKAMKCRECGEEMYLDDKDFDFKGKYDNYWNCPKCQTSCIEQVRFGKPFKELWHSENNDSVKDYVIRCS